ncbi:uncharacterized protein BDZ99DRAFT_521143 [Mytilinidion resinicola]|uniref:Uncharacterized protein n=1 Tax=Mytilinidion resinicola TaxID=574789 RepID=A0A6A6YMQ3_9PEZI|nr:uncharacterized protein BDZ99DRAFT_521143 [Mytilinidion resinicola]KAF2809828.1 hypothetical protein BDZ99DRAFT_521143 [Mytilinidion resinicola]
MPRHWSSPPAVGRDASQQSSQPNNSASHEDETEQRQARSERDSWTLNTTKEKGKTDEDKRLKRASDRLAWPAEEPRGRSKTSEDRQEDALVERLRNRDRSADRPLIYKQLFQPTIRRRESRGSKNRRSSSAQRQLEEDKKNSTSEIDEFVAVELAERDGPSRQRKHAITRAPRLQRRASSKDRKSGAKTDRNDQFDDIIDNF